MDATRMILLAKDAQAIMQVTDIWEIELEVSEAVQRFKTWHAGPATHYILQRGYVLSPEDLPFFPFPVVMRHDNYAPLLKGQARD